MQNAPLARLLTLTGGMLAATIATGTLAVRPQQPVPPVPVGSEVAKGLPAADPSKAATRFAKVVGWPEGTAPSTVAGFTVTLFAANLSSPRWLYVAPNGDVLVAESMGKPDLSPNKVTLLRDSDQDGRAEVRNTLLQGVRQPFGMLLQGDQLYVANTNALVRYPYRAGDTTITAPASTVLDLPATGFNSHWTRNVVANADGSKLFVSVGSGTNVDEEKEDEKDPRRAAVLEVNPDGTGMRVYASGLRHAGRRARPGLSDLGEGRRILWLAVRLLRADRRSTQERRTAGSGGEDDSSGLLARRACRATGPRVLHRLLVSCPVSPRCVRGSARILEPVAILGVQGRLRAFPARRAIRSRGGLPHRVHPRREREHGPWPPRRSRAARRRLAARGRRWRELRVAGQSGAVAPAGARGGDRRKNATRAPFSTPVPSG